MYSKELVCNLLDYIDSNLSNEITIDTLANTYYYNRYYIMKTFKQELNITIVDYINSMKISNSLNLYNNQYSITTIALLSGFNSLEYYSEIFKKIIGVSPLTYKKFINKNLVEERKEKIIKSSIINLYDLKDKTKHYRNNRKPKEKMYKHLSIFK